MYRAFSEGSFPSRIGQFAFEAEPDLRSVAHANAHSDCLFVSASHLMDAIQAAWVPSGPMRWGED